MNILTYFDIKTLLLGGIFFGAIEAALIIFLDKQINFLGKRN